MTGFFGRRIGRGPRVAWEGAASNRLLNDWVFMRSASADREIRLDLPTLRERSRDLVKNNSEIGRFINLIAHNVVGHQGIQLKPDLKTPQGDARTLVNRRLKQAWKRWGKKKNCTVDGKLSWVGVQRMVAKSVAQDGDIGVHFVRGFDNEFGFALQLVDADQISTTLNRDPEPGVNEIRMGVEVDRWGRAIAYHVLTRHPSNRRVSREPDRVLASDFLLPFVPHRVAASRGIPWPAREMFNTKMHKGYREAETTAARVAAAKMGFFVSKDEAGSPTTDEDEKKPLRMDAEPGLFEQLPDGWEFQGWDPSHPNTSYSEFSKAILRSIAAGLDVSYMSLTGDLSDVNFSSIRAGLITERDAWRALQIWLVDDLHDPVYDAWLPMARLTGHLDDRVRPSEYQTVTWKPRGWAWVDPQKEIKAAKEAVEAGFDTRTRIVAEHGRDIEEVFDELAEEQGLAADKGLSFEERTPDQGDEGVVGSGSSNGNGARNRIREVLQGIDR